MRTKRRRAGVKTACSRRGLSLAEVVVSTLLIGLLMAAALNGVGAAARSTNAAAEASDATALARQLLDEITVLPYEDPNQSPAFGLESGEAGAPGVRASFDDTDDYIDWVDSPPKDRGGVALAGYTGWHRTADVQKLDNIDFSVLPDASTSQGLRLITVVVTSPSGRVTKLQCQRAKDAGSLQSQGVGQTLVTWVGVSLQSGNGGAVTSGVSLINHAGDQ